MSIGKCLNIFFFIVASFRLPKDLVGIVKLLGYPAACRGHITDEVSPVESRSISPQGVAAALSFSRPRCFKPWSRYNLILTGSLDLNEFRSPSPPVLLGFKISNLRILCEGLNYQFQDRHRQQNQKRMNQRAKPVPLRKQRVL